ncbi:MAG: hypothetical protein ABSG35_09260 [Syntrophobacteraceae bacterium]|jgi:hypothetical protein
MSKAIALDTLIPDDSEYERFLAAMRKRFHDTIDTNGPLLFTTDAKDLFDIFLNEFPAGAIRQNFTCHVCKRFTGLYGGLVSICDDGLAISAVWPAEEAIPAPFMAPVSAVRKAISKANVTGVFLTSKNVWGFPVTGPWHHMAVTPVNGLVFKKGLQTPFQRMAECKEEFIMLKACLREFPLSAVEQALKVLRLDALYRSEKCLGVAEWLAALHKKLAEIRNKQLQDNLVWRAAASAPPGFCHVRSTMIGTLLDDIISGMDFDDISSRFAAKMHPLQYQRPQAPPSAENIAQAEKLIEEMKAAGSLARRFARVKEIQAIWRASTIPKTDKPQAGGVFSHLKPKRPAHEIRNLDVPAITMTWDKFQRTVLPDAVRLEFAVPHERMSYSAILTAVNEDAPPILQWDNKEQRNPFSWYVYIGMSMPAYWNLTPGPVDVTAICLQPSMWFSPEKARHQGESIILILNGAVDQRESGNAIFPETLKADFHGIRSTIEAYSRSARIEGREEASACGLRLAKEQKTWQSVRLIVTDGNGNRTGYDLDRWD